MNESQRIASSYLDKILENFGCSNSSAKSHVRFIHGFPPTSQTKSTDIHLSLIGAIPSAANALMAARILEHRGGPAQEIEIDLRRSHNYIDPDIGMTPSIWGQEIPVDVLSGNPFLRNIFETKDGRHVILSAVYVELVYKWTAFLRCSALESDIRAVVKQWDSKTLEAAAAEAGMPMAVVQSEETWAATEHGQHMAKLPIVPVEKRTDAPPKPLSKNPSRPLEGVKVLCCTHAIAGPSSGRTLAEHGASVLQIMFTHGYEHPSVYVGANLGCASARLNFHKQEDREYLWTLIEAADVWVDSYREGAIAKFGFTDEAMFARNSSLIISHVRCYGTTGPWSRKPGFDMQGSASSGLLAHCGDGLANPRWPPEMVVNDFTTGYYGALRIQAALLERSINGGGYVASPSLTGTAMSIMKYFKTSPSNMPEVLEHEMLPPESVEGPSGWGYLKTLRPLPTMSITPPRYEPIFLAGIGSSPPVFPGDEGKFDKDKVQPRKKACVKQDVEAPFLTKMASLAVLSAKYFTPN